MFTALLAIIKKYISLQRAPINLEKKKQTGYQSQPSDMTIENC